MFAKRTHVVILLISCVNSTVLGQTEEEVTEVRPGTVASVERVGGVIYAIPNQILTITVDYSHYRRAQETAKEIVKKSIQRLGEFEAQVNSARILPFIQTTKGTYIINTSCKAEGCEFQCTSANTKPVRPNKRTDLSDLAIAIREANSIPDENTVPVGGYSISKVYLGVKKVSHDVEGQEIVENKHLYRYEDGQLLQYRPPAGKNPPTPTKFSSYLQITENTEELIFPTESETMTVLCEVPQSRYSQAIFKDNWVDRIQQLRGDLQELQGRLITSNNEINKILQKIPHFSGSFTALPENTIQVPGTPNLLQAAEKHLDTNVRVPKDSGFLALAAVEDYFNLLMESVNNYIRNAREALYPNANWMSHQINERITDYLTQRFGQEQGRWIKKAFMSGIKVYKQENSMRMVIQLHYAKPEDCEKLDLYEVHKYPIVDNDRVLQIAGPKNDLLLVSQDKKICQSINLAHAAYIVGKPHIQKLPKEDRGLCCLSIMDKQKTEVVRHCGVQYQDEENQIVKYDKRFYIATPPVNSKLQILCQEGTAPTEITSPTKFPKSCIAKWANTELTKKVENEIGPITEFHVNLTPYALEMVNDGLPVTDQEVTCQTAYNESTIDRLKRNETEWSKVDFWEWENMTILEIVLAVIIGLGSTTVCMTCGYGCLKTYRQYRRRRRRGRPPNYGVDI